MATNVEVESKPGENSSNLLRRFSGRIRKTNIVKRSKECAQRTRPESKFKKKEGKLHQIKKAKEFKRLYKLGKIKPRRGRGRRR